MAKHDEKIKVLLAKVEEQKNNLGTKPKASWETNGIFKYPEPSNYFNLNTVREAQPLVDALAFLLERDVMQREAAEKLGVPAKQFSWNGYTLAEWEKDFKRRIDILSWEERKAKLDETKKKLGTLVSEEAKTEMELAAIEDSLS